MSRPSPTWLPEDRQVGLPTGQLCIGEQHDTVLGSFVETKHCLLVIFHWKKTKKKCPEFVSGQPRAAEQWGKEPNTLQKKADEERLKGLGEGIGRGSAFKNEFRYLI